MADHRLMLNNMYDRPGQGIKANFITSRFFFSSGKESIMNYYMKVRPNEMTAGMLVNIKDVKRF